MKDFNFNVGGRSFRVMGCGDYAICPSGGKRDIGFCQIGYHDTESLLPGVSIIAGPILENEVKAFIDGMMVMERFMTKAKRAA